jgi:hypothetical protein
MYGGNTATLRSAARTAKVLPKDLEGDRMVVPPLLSNRRGYPQAAGGARLGARLLPQRIARKITTFRSSNHPWRLPG